MADGSTYVEFSYFSEVLYFNNTFRRHRTVIGRMTAVMFSVFKQHLYNGALSLSKLFLRHVEMFYYMYINQQDAQKFL